MPPQARFEGVVDEETSASSSPALALSERTNPSIRKIHPRYLLAEDPRRAPMNPEEVHLMKRGERMMKQSRREAKTKYYNCLAPEEFETASEQPSSRKKKLANIFFFQRFSKSKLRMPRIQQRKQ